MSSNKRKTKTKETKDDIYKCIKKNNLSKFESFIEEHQINVREYRSDNQNTLLHDACNEGCDNIIRFVQTIFSFTRRIEKPTDD